MYENSRTTDTALAICYALTAVILLAIYRDPLSAMARDMTRWYVNRAPNIRSIRRLQGRMWADVNEAVDNARNA